MAKLTRDTWVVVADGEKALYLKNLNTEAHPDLTVFEHEEQENPPDREQGTSPPGRRPDVGAGQRSAMEQTDWHVLAKERFATEIAQHLYEAAHKGAFRHLVLVAPPHTLGALRAEMHKEVTDRIVLEIPKTLTNHPVDRIEALVRKEMAAV